MMWKIKSKHKDSSIWQEIKKELGPIYNKTNSKMKEFLEANPKMILGLMIIMIVASSVIAVIINQQRPEASMPRMEIQQSPDDIIQGFNELQQMQLKQGEIDYWTSVIEEIIKKETISLQDSMLVETAIKELEILNSN